MQNYPHVIVHAIFVKMGCFVWNWHNYAQFGRIHSLFLSVASVVFFRVAEKSRFASAEMIHADLQTDCRSGQHWNHAGSQALGKLITVFSMPLTSLLCCSCQTPSFRVRTHIHEYEYEFECTGAEKHENPVHIYDRRSHRHECQYGYESPGNLLIRVEFARVRFLVNPYSCIWFLCNMASEKTDILVYLCQKVLKSVKQCWSCSWKCQDFCTHGVILP